MHRKAPPALELTRQAPCSSASFHPLISQTIRTYPYQTDMASAALRLTRHTTAALSSTASLHSRRAAPQALQACRAINSCRQQRSGQLAASAPLLAAVPRHPSLGPHRLTLHVRCMASNRGGDKSWSEIAAEAAELGK